MPEKFQSIAKIQTWGAAVGQSRLFSFLKKTVRGENIGHASIELQLPATPSNKLMIEHYCNPPANIPYVKKTVGKNEDGTLQSIYVVHFSFIPSILPQGFELTASYEEDCVYEHAGANTIARQYLETHELMNRRAGSKIIRIYPLYSLTEKGRALDFSTPEGKYVLYQKALMSLVESKETIDKLKEKIASIKSFPQIMSKNQNLTLSIILKFLNIQYDEVLTQEAASKILLEAEAITKAQQLRRTELENLMKETGKNFDDDFFIKLPDYIAKGRTADSEVELPLGAKHGLHAEMMLAQMHDIAVSKYRFNVHNFNCSVTSTLILKAGLHNRTYPIRLKTFKVKTPQTLLEKALNHRDKQIAKPLTAALDDLEKFYADCEDKSVKVVHRDAATVREALLLFAIDTLYPLPEDQRANQFYVFSDQCKDALIQAISEGNDVVDTELLRDLWNIVPRTLPLSVDGAYKVLVDQNLTFKNLIQGLTTLAQINATKRLSNHPDLLEKQRTLQRTMKHELEKVQENDPNNQSESGLHH